MEFWERLKSELQLRGITHKVLAQKLNIQKSTLEAKFLRKNIPDVLFVYKIAKALDVSVEFLVNGDTSKSSTNSILSQKQKLLLQSFEKLNSLEQNAIIQLIDNLIKAKQ